MIYRVKDGISGEETAKNLLVAKGMRIVGSNVNIHGVGELDIVAMDGNTLVIVEVKARATDKMGHPLDAITSSKRKKIVAATAAYLEKCEERWSDIRFDVVTVLGDKVEHIEDAFYGKWK